MRTSSLPTSPRKSWDHYFMDIAQLVSERSTCLRRRVGAVLVRDKRILCTGYNGAAHGLDHCDEVGCLRDKLHIKPAERIEICRGIHAEQNALVQAAAFGISVSKAMLYCTHEPCITCTKMLLNAGIRQFVVKEPYPDKLGRKMLAEAHIKVRRPV
ncbi:MAG: cytidine/deoxycytidylate deaminase family protein [candidate division WOR-3 bacterium]|nr:cytidine/deoxycytidylate deaminase family protein [candidate division WOR-3 bacterium]